MLGTKVGSDTCGVTSSNATFLKGAKPGSGVSPTHPGSNVYPWRAENSSCPSQLQTGSNICGPVGGVCLGWAEASSSYPGAQAGSTVQGPEAGATCLHGTQASPGCFRPEPGRGI